MIFLKKVLHISTKQDTITRKSIFGEIYDKNDEVKNVYSTYGR